MQQFIYAKGVFCQFFDRKIMGLVPTCLLEIQARFLFFSSYNVTLSTSLLTFHLISSVHTSLVMFHFLQSTAHLISFHLPQSIFTLFGCIHITWSFNLIVSFTLQPIPSVEINRLRVSVDKFLILDRYSLLEAELQWFCHSLSLYIKQEIQHVR